MKKIDSEEFIKPPINEKSLFDIEENEKTPFKVKKQFFENVRECLSEKEIDQTPMTPVTTQKEKINITKPAMKDFILACLKESHKIFDCEHFSIQFNCKASQTEEKDSTEQPRYIKIAIILENKKNFYPIEDIEYIIKENPSKLINYSFNIFFMKLKF